MPSNGHEGQERNDAPPASTASPTGRAPSAADGARDERLRELGAELARLLREGRGHARPRGTSLRVVARDVAAAADDDHEVHRVLVDVSVAAQHLGRDGALRAYARSRRRTLDGGPAVALLDGVLTGVEQTPGG